MINWRHKLLIKIRKSYFRKIGISDNNSVFMCKKVNVKDESLIKSSGSLLEMWKKIKLRVSKLYLVYKKNLFTENRREERWGIQLNWESVNKMFYWKSFK